MKSLQERSFDEFLKLYGQTDYVDPFQVKANNFKAKKLIYWFKFLFFIHIRIYTYTTEKREFLCSLYLIHLFQ